MKPLLKKAATLLLGSGLSNLSGLLVFTFVVRFASKEDYGVYAFTQSLLVWSAILVQYAMSITGTALIAREPHNRVAETTSSILWLRFAIACVVGVLFLVLALSSEGLERALFLTNIPLLFAAALQLDFLALAQERVGVLSSTQSAAALFYVVASVASLVSGAPLWCLPLFQAIGQLGSAWMQRGHLLSSGTLIDFRGAREQAMYLFRVGWPATAAQFVLLGYYSVDLLTLRLTSHVSTASLGEYAATSRLMQAGILPLAAIANALAPRYGASVGRAHDLMTTVRAFLHLALVIGVLGGVVFASLAPWTLEAISGRQMWEAREVASIFGLVYFVIALHSPFSIALAYAGSRNAYLVANTLTFLSTLACCLVLVPTFGLVGAAWSLCIGVLVLVSYSFLAYRSLLRSFEGGRA
ncbi:lipopolysaccharide biosynthesis protein [Deinococcus yavapaiensis]|uniref:O-antigen/teichoic acid export membrane protein n=1 Tax=Deinococcus yavapaiensis KR-236 TaxID=694435 RepID=A0A318SBZ5_9DEIO|nr:oligosaccharide flippase family protein [Deinococcus yavapaiensis]PYE55904.1 O-antigen/teichoic acid export membrane protein [Deinococcus yavapaiensis KR-236]